MFDIVVAQFEEQTGQSLHDLEESLRIAIPAAERYVNVPDLVLRVAALRQGWSPTESSARRLDLPRLWQNWKKIERGIAGAVGFLEEERIFDKDRLPTIAVVPVIASIWSQMPEALDEHGQARTLLRQYLWRSFFTGRYEQGAATAALQDHRGLRDRIVDGNKSALVPILDEVRYPIAEVEELERAPWPRRRNTLARGILATALRGGGKDIADERPASRESLSGREYHHLFPASLLKNDACLSDSDRDLALNCALVTWNTNRIFSAKEPIAYLRERVECAPLGEEQVRQRLSSHTIPYDELNVGGYSCITDAEKKCETIKADYQHFITARARAIHEGVKKLCNGEDWNGL